MTSKKLHILDSLRGVIALFVVCYHFINFESHFGRVVPEGEVLKSIVNPLLEGSVSAFFLISGYVIYLHLERYNYNLKLFGAFMFKRFVRLHIPIIACILSIILINNAFSFYLGNPMHFSLNQFIANLTLTVPLFDLEWYNPILWTLSIEFQFYFFIALFFPLIEKRPFVLLLILAALFIPINFYFETEAIFTFYGQYFILGFGLYLIHQKQISLIQFTPLLALGCVDLFLNHTNLYPIIPLLTVPVILYIEKRFRLLEWIGNLSYSFYLMHGLFGGWFLYFAGRYAHTTIAQIGVIVLAVVVSFAGSYIFYLIIEKPSHKLSSKIKYK